MGRVGWLAVAAALIFGQSAPARSAEPTAGPRSFPAGSKVTGDAAWSGHMGGRGHGGGMGGSGSWTGMMGDILRGFGWGWAPDRGWELPMGGGHGMTGRGTRPGGQHGGWGMRGIPGGPRR